MTAERNVRRLICDSPFPIHNYSSIKIATVAFLIAGVVISLLNVTPFYDEFEAKYDLLSNDGLNRCSIDNFKVSELIKNIRSEVINQNEALDLVEEKLNTKSNFLSLAIIGSSGIGKTKFTQSFTKNFFWRENIQQHLWLSSQNINDVGNKIDLKRIFNNFKKCGRNLLIVDGLSVKCTNYINQFNGRIKNVVESAENMWLTIIYIFNLPRYDTLEEENFEINLEKFTNRISNAIHVIKFRTFNENDLYKCIKNECKILNASLTTEQINIILKSPNVKRSGCKNIQAKVLLYKYL